MDFHEKVVLITGATGGIGAALVQRLIPEQCKFILVARRENELKTLAHDIHQHHGECIFKPCDVKQKQDVGDTIAFATQHYGPIDVAILTAGVLIPNPIETFDSMIIKNSIEINFMGTVYFIEQLLPLMKQQKSGTIAAVSTLPDKRGVPGWGAYGSSKAAVSWLMESLRVEAKQNYNINMITIKPGSVQTPMIKDFPRRGAVPPEKAAEYIIRGIQKEKKVIQFPFFQVLTIRLTDLFPVFAYDKIPVDLQKGEGYPESKEK